MTLANPSMNPQIAFNGPCRLFSFFHSSFTVLHGPRWLQALRACAAVPLQQLPSKAKWAMSVHAVVMTRVCIRAPSHEALLNFFACLCRYLGQLCMLTTIECAQVWKAPTVTDI